MLIENFKKVEFNQFWPKRNQFVRKSTDANSISIVTAFFDLDRNQWGKGNLKSINPRHLRTSEDYLKYFSHLAKIKNQLIIYVDEKLAHHVLALRKRCGLEDNTIIFTHQNFFKDPSIAEIIHKIEFNMRDELYRFVWNPNSPKFHSAKYVLINSFKSMFVNRVINMNMISSDQAAWIDFGYCRSKEDMEAKEEWKFNAKNKINLFQIKLLDETPIFNIVKNLDIYFHGSKILGHIKNWSSFEKEIDQSFSSLLNCGFVDDDQLLLLMAYRSNPKNFILHPISAHNPRVVFKNFTLHAKQPSIELEAVKKRSSPIWLRELKLACRRSMDQIKSKIKISKTKNF
jgi:protein YibB